MIKKTKIRSGSKNQDQLKTEFPFGEKDEQAACIERMRHMQSEALKLWRSLKNKPK